MIQNLPEKLRQSAKSVMAMKNNGSIQADRMLHAATRIEILENLLKDLYEELAYSSLDHHEAMDWAERVRNVLGEEERLWKET